VVVTGSSITDAAKQQQIFSERAEFRPVFDVRSVFKSGSRLRIAPAVINATYIGGVVVIIIIFTEFYVGGVGAFYNTAVCRSDGY
jgi:hypothetical protein